MAMATSSAARTSSLREARKATDMRYNKLGDSDLLVSEVCLGTMTWGKQNSEEEAMRQLDMAFDKYGVNFVDTAEGYPIPLQPETAGDTDRMIGKWMSNRARDKVVVASKLCGSSRRLTWFRDDGKGTRVTRKQIIESVDKSLMRLGTDYIDLMQIHWPDRYVPLFGPNKYDVAMETAAVSFEEQLEAMNELIQQGKIRHWGLSNETPFGVMAFVSLAMEQGLAKPVSVQNSYSLLTREFESGLAEVCSPSHTNTALLPYSPLSAGVLTGKYDVLPDAKAANLDMPDKAKKKGAFEGTNPKSRLNLLKGYRARYESSAAPAAVAEYSQLAAKYGMSPSQFSLAFVASRPFVPSTIIGATSGEQLEENLEAFAVEFTQEMLDDIEDVASRYPDPWRTPQPGGG
eukprot:Tamp_04680.p1 GENE.Tamp_04680~~Tamp_04680.p1  ORF type:complete len:402 (+),score=110.87 Tamp_04680:1772-2977(+)